MLKASEANKIANGYYSERKTKMLEYLEQSIIARAKDGFKWFPWDYSFEIEYGGISAKDVQDVVFELRSAGYDVKDHKIMKEIVIRW